MNVIKKNIQNINTLCLRVGRNSPAARTYDSKDTAFGKLLHCIHDFCGNSRYYAAGLSNSRKELMLLKANRP